MAKLERSPLGEVPRQPTCLRRWHGVRVHYAPFFNAATQAGAVAVVIKPRLDLICLCWLLDVAIIDVIVNWILEVHHSLRARLGLGRVILQCCFGLLLGRRH